MDITSIYRHNYRLKLAIYNNHDRPMRLPIGNKYPSLQAPTNDLAILDDAEDGLLRLALDPSPFQELYPDNHSRREACI
jgi:hypothetical protein